MTPDQQSAYLDSIANGIPPARAARAASTTEAKVKALRSSDDDFAERLEVAESRGASARVRPPPSMPVHVPAPLTKAPASQPGGTVPHGDGTDHDAGKPHPTTTRARPATPSRDVDEQPPALDAERIAAAARELAPGPFGYLLWVNAAMVNVGFPELSPWWRFTIEDFYESEKQWLIVGGGRGLGKSTVLEQIAVVGNVFSARQMPPGQRWIWPFISIGRPDSHRRIVGIQAILSAASIPIERIVHAPVPMIDLLDVHGNPVAFAALASTIAGVSGPSTTGCTIDEEDKLFNKDASANPSREILAAVVQTFRARPGIVGVRSSSPWKGSGSLSEAIRQGDTSANYVARVGNRFVSVVVDGLNEVATWEEQQGDIVAAQKIRAYALTVTATCPNIPTWLGNPTIGPLASRKVIDAATMTSGMTRADYWLRENAALPVVGGQTTAGVNQTAGLADANRKMLDDARGVHRRGYNDGAWSGRDAVGFGSRRVF